METGAKPGDPAYLKAAFSKLGLSEIEGAKHEKQVLAMYAAAGHPEIHDDETPWCAAFVGWCLNQAGLPNTGSLLARSYAKYGTPVPFSGYRVPRGAICVWSRAGGGHVNFCLDDDGTYLTCIGGNQENSKGGGVTVSRRSKTSGLIAAVLPLSWTTKSVPPPDVERAPKKTKPATKSTEILTSLGAALTTIGSAVSGFLTSWQGQVAIVVVIALAAGYLIYRRKTRGDISGWFK